MEGKVPQRAAADLNYNFPPAKLYEDMKAISFVFVYNQRRLNKSDYVFDSMNQMAKELLMF